MRTAPACLQPVSINHHLAHHHSAMMIEGPSSNNHAHAQPDVVGRAARGSAFSKGTAVCPRGQIALRKVIHLPRDTG